MPGQHELRVSANVARLHNNFYKTFNNAGIPALNITAYKSPEENHSKPKSKFLKFAYFTGLAAAALQVTSGIAFMVLSKLGGKEKLESAKAYKGKAAIFANIAFSTLGLSYLICAPSTLGAGINSKQPGIVLHSIFAGVLGGAIGLLTILGRKSLGTRAKGLLSLAYAPLFAGFANKIQNDTKNKKSRQMNIDFMTNKNTYLNIFKLGQEGKDIRKKFLDSFKFTFKDIVNSFKFSGQTFVKTLKQSKNYIMGKRKQKPDIFSIKPSKESMYLASVLAILGSIPKVLFGEKLGSKKLKILDVIIGAGFMFDSLGMISLANANNDSRKLPMLIGGPMRITGDFAQENNFFYGLRTLGGSAAEYYYALVNKEKDGKLQNKQD